MLILDSQNKVKITITQTDKNQCEIVHIEDPTAETS